MKRLALAALSLGLPFACESSSDDDTAGTDVGNPVVLALRVAPGGERIVDGAGAAYRLESAEGQVSQVQLTLAEGERCASFGVLPGGVTCSDDTRRIGVRGSLRADLLDGSLEPEVRVPVGRYAHLDLRAGPGPTGEGIGLRLVLDGEDGRRYQVTLAPDTQLRFEPAEEGSGAVLFRADPGAWLAEVDLAACAARLPGQGAAPLTVDPTTGTCSGPTGR